MLVWFFRRGWIGEGRAEKGLPRLLAWLLPKR
jgi:hypothetical protein